MRSKWLQHFARRTAGKRETQTWNASTNAIEQTVNRACYLRKRGQASEALALIECLLDISHVTGDHRHMRIRRYWRSCHGEQGGRLLATFVLLLGDLGRLDEAMKAFQAFCDLDGTVEPSLCVARLQQGYGRWNRSTAIYLLHGYAGILERAGHSGEGLAHLEAFLGLTAHDYSSIPVLTMKLSRGLQGVHHRLACNYVSQLAAYLVVAGCHEKGLNLFSAFFRTPKEKDSLQQGDDNEVVRRLLVHMEGMAPVAKTTFLMPLFWCLSRSGFFKLAVRCFEATLGLAKGDFLLPGVLSCHLSIYFEGLPAVMVRGFLHKVGRILLLTGSCGQSIALMTAGCLPGLGGPDFEKET